LLAFYLLLAKLTRANPAAWTTGSLKNGGTVTERRLNKRFDHMVAQKVGL
jgi:hypothetical protein